MGRVTEIPSEDAYSDKIHSVIYGVLPSLRKKVTGNKKQQRGIRSLTVQTSSRQDYNTLPIKL